MIREENIEHPISESVLQSTNGNIAVATTADIYLVSEFIPELKKIFQSGRDRAVVADLVERNPSAPGTSKG